jgi:HK97 family phage portal protein
MTSAVSYLPLAGNAYFEKLAPLTGPNKGIPQELYVLRPDRMRVMVDKTTGLKKGYEYDMNGRRTQWEVDLITGESPILQTKTFHPLNDWYGLADVEPAARDIDTSNSAANWQKNMMDNEGRPGMIVGVESGLGDEAFDQIEKDLKTIKEGPSNAGKTFILEGVNKVSPYSWKPKEMDFLKSRIETARNICMGLGVPPMLIGIPGESTFANFAEAREYFWDTTISYYLKFIRDELNHWIFGVDEDSLFLDFIIDNVPALSAKRSRVWKRANESEFLTVNEKREMVGKEKLDEGGDIVLVDSSKIPLTEVGLSEETEEEEEATRNRLLNEGYSQEEVNQFLGLPKDGDVADKSCRHTLQ